MEGYYGFGVVAGNRLNPAETAFAVHPATLPWLAISLVFAIFYVLVWLQRADYRQPRKLVALTGFTLTLFLLYSKGFSPQFLVYLLPFIVLLFPNRRGVAYSLLLTVLNVLEQPHLLRRGAGCTPTAVGCGGGALAGAGVLLLEFAAVIWTNAAGPIWPACAATRRRRWPSW